MVSTPQSPRYLSTPVSPPVRTIVLTEGHGAGGAGSGDGMDSDEEVVELFDAHGGEVLDEEEITASSCPPTEPPAEAALAPAPVVVLSDEEIRQMKVGDLKSHIIARGGSSTDPSTSKVGKKEYLRKRLTELRHQPLVSPATTSASRASKARSWISPGARWVEVLPDSEPAQEPERPEGFHGPTEAPGPMHPKYNFTEHMGIDRSRCEFDGKAEDTEPDPEWLKEKKLSKESHPIDFVNAWFPDHAHNEATGKQNEWSWGDMATFTNLKATLAGVGTQIYSHEPWTPTDVPELKKLIGTFLLQGLNPSPDITMKFSSSKDDPVNGSDLVSAAWSPSGEKRFKVLKCVLAAQDPRVHPPSKKEQPNFKVNLHLHMQLTPITCRRNRHLLPANVILG